MNDHSDITEKCNINNDEPKDLGPPLPDLHHPLLQGLQTPRQYEEAAAG